MHYSPPPLRVQSTRSYSSLRRQTPAFVTIRDYPISRPMVTFSFI